PYVRDGTVREFALWNVENLVVSSGEITGRPGERFSVPTLGDDTIGDNGVVVLGRPQLFAADNIDQFNF
ncbi:MAG: rhamnose ABC transporter substrate-binding protein, partial [Chloroflexi bacterium]|nr:rhamnose ABC transporter substrate-binding protein [Chloroflexota bacterium]